MNGGVDDDRVERLNEQAVALAWDAYDLAEVTAPEVLVRLQAQLCELDELRATWIEHRLNGS